MRVNGIVRPLTCGPRPGEDKLRGAAALDLPTARVDVDAVHRERLQSGDLQLALLHRLLHKVKLNVGRPHIRRRAAVPGGLLRRGGAAVAVQAGAPGLGGVGYGEEVPAASIRRPGEERKSMLERTEFQFQVCARFCFIFNYISLFRANEQRFPSPTVSDSPTSYQTVNLWYVAVA